MKHPLYLLGLFFAACGPTSASERGEALFYDAKLSVSPTNVFSCGTCHQAKKQEPAGRRFPGYAMDGVAKREGFWGGEIKQLLDAVNFCYTEFMRAEKLTPDNEQGLAILAYLQSMTTTAAPAEKLTIVNNITPTYVSSLPSGDGANGGTLYGNTCAPCHGDLHTGNGRIGPYVSDIPDDTIAVFGAQARAVIAEKIRHGKFFGIGGNMPPYSVESLSDKELADLLAYILP